MTATALILLLVLFLLPLLLFGTAGQETPDEAAPTGELPIDRTVVTPQASMDSQIQIRVALDDGSVLTLGMDQYLWRVVAAEMPASFEPEALKAQAAACLLYTSVMGATFALLIVGVLKWGWYINEISGLFLGMGIIVGFVGRVGLNGFGVLFGRGVADFATGALAVGFARGVLIVLEEGNILHTILYGASGLLTSLPTALTVLGMSVFQNFLNLLIPSASGQAVSYTHLATA